MFNAAQRIKALLATLNPDAVFFDDHLLTQ